MRVLLIAPRFPPDVGGLEAYAGWVARTVSEAPGHSVLVVTTTPDRHTVRESLNGIDVIRLPTWFTLSNTPLHPLWWWQLRDVIRRWDPDVLNVHSPVPGLPDLATFAAGRVPVVMTYHSGSLVKGHGGPVDALLRAYERHVLPRVFARCRRLIAVSPVSTAYATGRADLVPPGVDTQMFKPVVDSTSTEGSPRIVYAGRLQSTSRWKGVDVLLEAMPAVLRRAPATLLDVVGDGDDVLRLRRLAHDVGVAEHVVWHGSLDHRGLARVLAGATVVALPSLTESESFGMTLVEAMASGAAVVGSDVGGIPFVVRPGVDGLLVPPGDAIALGTALTELVTDPDRARAMGLAGREAAVSRWEWRHRRDQTLRILTEACS